MVNINVNRYGKQCSKYTNSPYNGHTHPIQAKINRMLYKKSKTVQISKSIHIPTHMYKQVKENQWLQAENKRLMGTIFGLSRKCKKLQGI